MGEGIVLEHGTHDELLRNGESAYSLLVRAQNLRGGAYATKESATDDNSVDQELQEGPDDKLIGRARKGTFSSDTYGHAVQETMKETKDSYSFLYLLKRMAKLNRGSKWSYAIGSFFSASKRQIFCILAYIATDPGIVVGLTHPAFAIVWGEKNCCIILCR